MADEKPESLPELPPNRRRSRAARQRKKVESIETTDGALEEEERSTKKKPRKRIVEEKEDLTIQEKGERFASGVRSLFRLPSPDSVDESDSGPKKILSAIRPIIVLACGVIYVLFSHLRHVFGYYATHRRGIWEFVLDIVKHVPATEIYVREIRIPEKEGREYGFLKGGKWRVRLPKRCVECGTGQKLETEHHFGKIEHYERPLFGISLAVVFTFIAAVWSLSIWNILTAPFLGLFIGCFLGYYLRKRTNVRVDYHCCRKHANNETYPHIRLHGDELFVLTGDRKVRDAYIQTLEESGLLKR